MSKTTIEVPSETTHSNQILGRIGHIPTRAFFVITIPTNAWKQNPHLQPLRGKEVQQQSKIHEKKWQHNQQKFTIEKRGKEVWRRKGIEESSKQGEQKNDKDVHMGSIKIQAVGNGWLFRSAIAKMSMLVSTKDLEYVFRRERNIKVQVKAMGRRFVIITFSDSACRDLIIEEKWLSKWFEETSPWKGEQAMEERFVWLACYGMPLNAWSSPTFKVIGEKWGKFLKIDEDTLKESSYVKARILIATNQIQKLKGYVDLIIDGLKYSVRVIEEDSFRFIMQSLIDPSLELIIENKKVSVEENGDKEMYKDEVEYAVEVGSKYGEQNSDKTMHKNEVEIVADVGSKYEEINDPITEVVEYSNKEVDMPNSINETACSSMGLENSLVGGEVVADSFEKYSKESQSQTSKLNCLLNQDTELMMHAGIEKATVNDNVSNDLFTEENSLPITLSAGYLISVVGKEMVDENLKQNDNAIIEEELNQDHFEANHVPIQAAVKGIKGKSKRKNINDILGYSKVDKGTTKGRRNKNKCVMLRSAVASAALSASLSSGGINNRNRILLDEAKAIWEVDKLFGLRYDGDEREVISKIADMEALNKARNDCHP